jgi:hypothetical protein
MSLKRHYGHRNSSQQKRWHHPQGRKMAGSRDRNFDILTSGYAAQNASVSINPNESVLWVWIMSSLQYVTRHYA